MTEHCADAVKTSQWERFCHVALVPMAGARSPRSRTAQCRPTRIIVSRKRGAKPSQQINQQLQVCFFWLCLFRKHAVAAVEDENEAVQRNTAADMPFRGKIAGSGVLV